jgi:Ca2+/Na+ antiporter
MSVSNLFYKLFLTFMGVVLILTLIVTISNKSSVFDLLVMIATEIGIVVFTIRLYNKIKSKNLGRGYGKKNYGFK